MRGAGRLFVFRHGETFWNRERRIQGHKDSPLTALGVRQALAMGESLRGRLTQPAAVRFFVSPSGRCRQTAALIAEGAGLAYGAADFRRELMEVGCGLWEGLLRTEVDARWPGATDARESDLWEYRPHEGESYRMASVRIRSFLDELAAPGDAREGATGDNVIVGHGGTGKLLRGLAVGMSGPELLATLDHPQDAYFAIENGEMTRIELEP